MPKRTDSDTKVIIRFSSWWRVLQQDRDDCDHAGSDRSDDNYFVDKADGMRMTPNPKPKTLNPKPDDTINPRPKHPKPEDAKSTSRR